MDTGSAAGALDLLAPRLTGGTLILVGFIGAKLLAAFGEWQRYGDTLMTWGGPLAVQGALGSILIGMWLWTFLTGREPLPVLDATARALAVLLVPVRIGCLSVGCCFGHKSDLPWAILGPDGALRHPTQVYELLFVLVLIGVLFGARWVESSRMARPGSALILFLCAYGAGRLGLEFLRDDTQPIIGWVSYPQIVSVLMLAAGLSVSRLRGRLHGAAPAGLLPRA